MDSTGISSIHKGIDVPHGGHAPDDADRAAGRRRALTKLTLPSPFMERGWAYPPKPWHRWG